MKGRKVSGSDVVFWIFAGLLSVFFLIFGIRIARRFHGEKMLYQSVVSLEGLECGEDFEGKLKEIPGISSFIPVIEVPVTLKVEEYRMEATLVGVEFDRLEKQVSRSRKTPLGNTAVLLLGEESLAVMTDQNGHGISEEKKKEFLERYGELEWQYCMAGEEAENWKPCLIAGTLSLPAGDIYISYSQAKEIMGTEETSKFLLTVRGEENYEKALGYFGAGSTQSK
ncbi:MAG: hypothetical protein HFI68_09445 [Lachnospiraceae bacterium]|nr:hypothetical protein [Lachnospiraceae bacterium]